MDKNQKLKQYFIDEINRVSSNELLVLEQELATLKNEQETQVKKEVQNVIQKHEEIEQRNLFVEQKKAMALVQENQKHVYMEKRDALVDQLFDELKAKLLAFANSDKYEDYLNKKLAKFNDLAKVKVVVRSQDQAFFSDAKWNVETSDEIVLGGFKVLDENKGRMFDETLDEAFNEAKSWFINSSKFSVK